MPSSSSSSSDESRRRKREKRKSKSSKRQRLEKLESKLSELTDLVKASLPMVTRDTLRSDLNSFNEAEKEKGTDEANYDLQLHVLDEEVMQLLGEPVKHANKGPAVHTELKTRWESIAKSGMPKADRDTIREKYKPPKNCNVGAPLLNAELSKAVNAYTKSRDDELFRVQNDIETSISVMGQLLTSFLDDQRELSRHEIIAQLSDCARFLVGTQLQVSSFRRRQIRPNIKDTTTHDMLQDISIYPQLFGEDLALKVKQAHSVAKVSLDMTNGPEKRQSGFLVRDNKEKDQPFTKLGNYGKVSRETLNSRRPFRNLKPIFKRGGQKKY
ncbi:unnamed protein product [Orchesella dallaii]|uniref:Uncharacterized protein n=1 Tax=Orchesella dallaii TaxID=48710 RepID=A0ABP1R089_9HEXA